MSHEDIQPRKEIKLGEDCIGVTVVFFCHDGEGRFLLHQRSNNCRDEQGKWDNGGGALDFGESWDTAVAREIKEEYCTDVINIQFITAKNVLREKNGNPTHWVSLLFAVEIDPSQVAIGEPHKMDAIGWFREEDFPDQEELHSSFPTDFLRVKAFLSARR